MQETVIAETPRLRLRPFETRDEEALARLLCDQEVMSFSRGAKKPDEIGGWIEGCLENYARFGFGLWAVVRRDAGNVIGYCGLTQFPDLAGQPEIELGFRLAREFWSRGYATESATAVRDYAFTTLALSGVVALVDPGNTASIRLVEKIGMTYEQDVMLPGYDHPDRLYAIRRAGRSG